MARYRIVCTVQVPADAHPRNAKIVAVGTGTDADRAARRWEVKEVVAAMDAGDSFYTKGDRSGRVAEVEKYWCAVCGEWHIRSAPDAVLDNNLDSLRTCRGFGS